MSANLAVLEVHVVGGKLLYELYVGADRTLRLWSPAGGLGRTGPEVLNPRVINVAP